MSTIRFCTTPKGDLPHHSYIFRTPDPFGEEMKNMACSRSGTMLQPYKQTGKKAMKTSNFQKYLRGTAACMKRLMVAAKGCGQLTSNYTYFSDSWSSGAKTAEEAMTEGLDYYGPVKNIHKGFFLATLGRVPQKRWLLVSRGGKVLPFEGSHVV